MDRRNKEIEGIMSAYPKDIWFEPKKETAHMRLDAAEKIAQAVKDRVAETVKTIQENYSHTAYCSAGNAVKRGYFCPDPLIEIIVSNVRRGRLVKTEPKGDRFSYWFDENDRLILVEKITGCGIWSTQFNEVLFYIDGYRIGVMFKSDYGVKGKNGQFYLCIECNNGKDLYSMSEISVHISENGEVNALTSIYTWMTAMENGRPVKRISHWETVGEPLELMKKVISAEPLLGSVLKMEDFTYFDRTEAWSAEYGADGKVSAIACGNRRIVESKGKKPVLDGMF
ncbi:MAG: hypothetical protein K6F68_01075 [Clostridiales bacterium]|nr:hypothetical protein [Clostridiales bacterium]